MVSKKTDGPNLRTVTSSSPGVLSSLRWVRSQNFTPVALHAGKKAAAFKKDSEQFTNPSDTLWERNNYGIGVLTGGHGPMDVDLDCSEAVFFAPRFLPPTEAKFGRMSKLDSHWLYRSNDFSDSVRFMDASQTASPGKPATMSMIVELRGQSDSGTNVPQTVLPGNIHEGTGELVTWSGGAPPRDVPSAEHAVLKKAAGKIAAATLIVRHLWHEGMRNHVCMWIAGIMAMSCEWDVEEAKDFIRAVMDYTGDDDKTRMINIERTYRAAGLGKNVGGAGKLRELSGNNKLVDDLVLFMGGKDNSWISEYNERFAVVSYEGKCRVADTRTEPTKDPVLFDKDNFVNMFIHEHAGVNEKGKAVVKPVVWFHSPKRRMYDSIEFAPGQESEIIRGDRRILNSFTGWATKPSPEGGCSRWLELLHDTICGGNEKQYNWLLQWFAQILIEPEKKPMTSPVFIGEEGAGKTLLIDYFSEILGDYYLHVTHAEVVHNHFNAHMERALLLHSEEAVFGGDQKHAAIIRSLITDKQGVTTRKGIDSRRGTSFLRLIHSSNKMNAVAAALGDRRYSVFDLGKRSIKNNDAFKKAILSEMAHGGPAALHHYLTCELAFDPSVPRSNIKNSGLAKVQAINLPPIASFWRAKLEDGEILPDFLKWAQKPIDDPWPQVVSSKALYEEFVHDYCRSRNIRTIPNDVTFNDELTNLCDIEEFEKRRPIYDNPYVLDGDRSIPPWVMQLKSGRQRSIMNMPSLKECRDAFERRMGISIDWPVDEEMTPAEKDAAKRNMSDRKPNDRF